jgi:endo-1,4-beta-mannosidase
VITVEAAADAGTGAASARQERMSDHLLTDEHPGIETLPWLGVNFWSRCGGPRMWVSYDGAVVREELAVLRAHDLDVTRSFCFWPDFVPAPELLDEDVMARFGDFLDAHVELGLRTIPTFLVGHMSGQNWDPAWRQGRDLYRDVWLVAQQAWFAGEVARRVGTHPAICGWLVSNEMPLYGGPASAEEVAAWARLVTQAVRAAGATQPISLGDGAWGVETTGVDNGYSLRDLAPLVDWIGPHSYPMQDDPLRLALAPAFACELAGSFGKPVVLEEFGVSSAFASEDNAAAHYRVVLATTLLAGARGWLAWCNTDFDDLRGEDPYRHHPFELHFGLTDHEGRPKEQLRALSSFARLARELAADGAAPVSAEVALVVPEHFERELPFTSQAYRDDARGNLLQAYVAAREADLPLRVARERDGIDGGARLYLCPSAKLLTAPGVDRLLQLATAGATVYLSFFTGSTDDQRGPWLTGLEPLFGVRHGLRHGLVDPVVGDEVTFDFVEPLGEIAAGTRLTFAVAGTASARAHLPVEPAGAEVVAVDGYGRPALLRHALGAGRAVLCTYPLEHFASRTPWANPESTWRIYSALATDAGVSRPVRADDPRVLCGVLRGATTETALLVNCSGDALSLEPPTVDDAGPPGPPLEIGPYGVVAAPLSDVTRERALAGARETVLAVAAPTKGGMPSSHVQTPR